MEENKKDVVYIPYGIKNRREFFTGFGVAELKYTMLSLPVAASISFFISAVFDKQIVSSLSLVLIPIGTAILVQKDDCNLSVLDYGLAMLRFKRSRKFYAYRGNQWDI